MGNQDADGRYNAKWFDLNTSYKSKKDDLGAVDIGDFRRGQGGLFTTTGRPFNKTNVVELF